MSVGGGAPAWTDEQFYLWVGLLRTFTRYVEKSLLREFFHDVSVLEDWQFTLGKLLDATAPWFTRLGDDEPPEELSYFKARIMGASRSLASPQARANPTDAIYFVLNEVALARHALNQWQIDPLNLPLAEKAEQQGQLFLDHWVGFPFPSRALTGQLILDAFQSLDKALAQRDEFAICMASRRLCHLLFYAATLHFDLWRQARPEAIRLHAHLIDVMRAGPPRESVQSRHFCLVGLSDDVVIQKAVCRLFRPVPDEEPAGVA